LIKNKMIRKKNKSKFLTGLFLTPYFFTLVCLILLAVIVLPVYQNARQRFGVNNQIAALQKQITSLESSNDDLTKLETYLQSDQFAEKEARENLGLKMPGEKVAVIENSDSNAAGPLQSGITGDYGSGQKKTNPEEWLNYFFGR
jgi:cell division protein FtsL